MEKKKLFLTESTESGRLGVVAPSQILEIKSTGQVGIGGVAFFTAEEEAELDVKRLLKASNSANVVALDGRWMVTGPENQDGTGWTLCEADEDGRCIQCWADINTRAQAMRVFDAMRHFDMVEPLHGGA